MRFYLRDTLLPELDSGILNILGVGRDEFVQNVIYGELTRDPTAYDESVICSMDDFLVQNLTQMEYDYFLGNMGMRLTYEDNYVKTQETVARYLKPLLKHYDYQFDLRLNPNHGHYVELVSC